MFKTQFLSLLPLVATLAAPALAVDVTDLQVDFESQTPGNYTKTNLNTDFPDATNNTAALLGFPDTETATNGRATIEDFGNGNNVLKVKYPQGVVGVADGGAQFYKPLPVARDEYYLEYRVKFLAGFDFGRAGSSGGKLPGLGGGTQPAGGNYSPDGFSTRYMWHPADGTDPITSKPHLNLYFYYADQPSRTQPAGQQYGEAVPLAAVTTETYYTVRQHVKLNTPGQPDGILQIWVNGASVYFRNDLKYRWATGTYKIDDLFFCTFYGGNLTTDAPRNDSYVAFDDFKVWHPGTAAAKTSSSTTGSASGS